MKFTQKCFTAFKKNFVIFFLFLPFSYLTAQNNALQFDGTNDNVTLPYNAGYNFSTSDKFTIELWFKTGNYTTVLLSNHLDVSPYAGYEVAVVAGKVVFDLTNNYLTNSIRIETINSYNDGAWHHVACVYKGVPSASSIDIYVDGLLQSQNVTNNNLTSSFSVSNSICLGSRANTSYYLNGGMDEVRIWQRALCGTEISARKDCHLIGDENALLAYYNFNQGSASSSNTSINSLINSSAVANLTGTLTNFALSGSSSNWVTSGTSVTGTCSSFGPTVSITGNTLLCTAGSTTLSIAGASNYTWLPVNTVSASIVLTPSVTSNYTIAYPSGSCTAFSTATVLVVSSPSIVTAASSTLVCSGDASNLSVTSSASSYTWYPANSSGSLITVNPLSTSVYTVSGFFSGCGVFTRTIAVNVLALPVISALASSNAICFGNTTTLSASGGISYTWMPGNSNSQNISVSPGSFTTYTVMAYDGACTGKANVSILVTNYPVLTIVATPSTVCAGVSTTLSVAGALSYVWIPSSSTATSIVVNPTSSGNYTVYGASGVCGTYSTVNVIVTPNPVLSISAAASASLVCPGQTVSFLAFGATNYSWLPSGSLGASLTINPLTTSTYTLIGNTGNCTSTLSKVVTVAALPSLSVSSTPSVLCAGSQATLHATGGTTYTWFPGNITGSVITVTPAVSTTYSLMGSNSACSVALNTTLSVVPAPNVTVSILPSMVCKGASVNLSAGGALSYSWNVGSNDSLLTVTPLVNTSYSLSYSTSFCEGNAMISLTVNPLPLINVILTPSILCSGETVTLLATGGLSYTWQPGFLSGAQITITPTASTTYTVVGADINGCSDTKLVMQIVTNCTGIDEEMSLGGLIIYPNPSAGVFIIEALRVIETTEIILVNQLGQIVYTQRLISGKNEIEAQRLSPGIYECIVLENKITLGRKKVVVN